MCRARSKLSQLLRALGRRRVVFVIDPPSPLGPNHAAGLADLFRMARRTDNPGFAIGRRCAHQVLEASSLLARARGRAGLVYTNWTADECHDVAGAPYSRGRARYAGQVAGGVVARAGPSRALTRWWPPTRPSPAAWAGLAESLLYLTRRAPDPLSFPLRPADLPRLRATLLQPPRRLRLDLDPRAVWRGRG